MRVGRIVHRAHPVRVVRMLRTACPVKEGELKVQVRGAAGARGSVGDRGAGGGTAGGEQRVVVADNGDCTAARPRGSQAAAEVYNILFKAYSCML